MGVCEAWCTYDSAVALILLVCARQEVLAREAQVEVEVVDRLLQPVLGLHQCLHTHTHIHMYIYVFIVEAFSRRQPNQLHIDNLSSPLLKLNLRLHSLYCSVLVMLESVNDGACLVGFVVHNEVIRMNQ